MNQVLMGVALAARDTPLYRGNPCLLEANLPLIRRVIAFTCRRYRFSPDEAEEFESIVYVKLAENDEGILHAFKGESSLSTYLSTVIQRMALDYRIHEKGKWHASAEARRMGAMAVELELILHRDKRTIEEALLILAAKHPDVTLDSLKTTAARFRPRPPRPQHVPAEDAEHIASTDSDAIEDRASADERRRTADRVAALVRQAIAQCPEDIRLVLQLHFIQKLTVAQIARALHHEQKLLYRRIKTCMDEIRATVREAGFRDEDVIDLIGRDDVFLDFNLGDTGNDESRPSKEGDERVAKTTEDPE